MVSASRCFWTIQKTEPDRPLGQEAHNPISHFATASHLSFSSFHRFLFVLQVTIILSRQNCSNHSSTSRCSRPVHIYWTITLVPLAPSLSAHGCEHHISHALWTFPPSIPRPQATVFPYRHSISSSVSLDQPTDETISPPTPSLNLIPHCNRSACGGGCLVPGRPYPPASHSSSSQFLLLRSSCRNSLFTMSPFRPPYPSL